MINWETHKSTYVLKIVRLPAPTRITPTPPRVVWEAADASGVGVLEWQNSTPRGGGEACPRGRTSHELKSTGLLASHSPAHTLFYDASGAEGDPTVWAAVQVPPSSEVLPRADLATFTSPSDFPCAVTGRTVRRNHLLSLHELELPSSPKTWVNV